MKRRTGFDGLEITRREALRRVGALAAWPVAVRAAERFGLAEDEVERPNILLLVADDLGYGDLSCYGAKDIRTPNIDSLASEGVRFSQFYVSTPLCAPMRVSMMTGRYPLRTTLSQNPDFKNPDDGLSPDETTVAEVLKNAGYATGLIGKWHLGYAPKFNPRRQGFDEYFGFLSGWADYYKHRYNEGTKWMFLNDEPHDEEGYMTELLARHAIDFLARHRGKRFFLEVAFNAPHFPDQAPEEYVRRSKRGVYGAMVECLDDNIGRILTHLRKLGLDRKTLVIFVSDNGAEDRGSNAPLRGRKGSLWEGGIRVPFIARWPGRIPAGRVSNELAVSMDIFSMIAAAGGGQPPKCVANDGKNVLPVMEGNAKSPHEILFWSHEGQSAVRRGRWKLVRDRKNNRSFYDLDADVGETKDLASENPEIVRELSGRLDEWLKEVRKR
jgi:arylsulfatase A-like enzyme